MISFPQKSDYCCSKDVSNHTLCEELVEPMRPIGPWATGKCDWNPSSGLTGVRPVVDHYSITRFSTNEWSQRNADIYAENHQIIQKSLKYLNFHIIYCGA